MQEIADYRELPCELVRRNSPSSVAAAGDEAEAAACEASRSYAAEVNKELYHRRHRAVK
jgi:hypothetical protein